MNESIIRVELDVLPADVTDVKVKANSTEKLNLKATKECEDVEVDLHLTGSLELTIFNNEDRQVVKECTRRTKTYR